jgi:(p)ppGpp synthase/HD superfamily hydrolase
MNRYEALKHAALAHAGQVDKCGNPYIAHPIAVAEAAALHGRSATISVDNLYTVGLLHDVLEDTDYQIPSEELAGCEARALVALTRQTEREPHPETYAEYLERVCDSELACIVKLADLWHNLSPVRQLCLPASERTGLERRYLKARDRIWQSIGYEWWPGEGKG